MLRWTARCKSGYQFQRQGRGKWRSCQRFCSRGELLCSECATAEVVEPLPSRQSEPLIVRLNPFHAWNWSNS
jgi:hypothetical protein